MKMANLDAVFDDLFTNPKTGGAGDVSFRSSCALPSQQLCSFDFRSYGFPKKEASYSISPISALVLVALPNTFYGDGDGRLTDSA